MRIPIELQRAVLSLDLRMCNRNRLTHACLVNPVLRVPLNCAVDGYGLRGEHGHE
jgi:hypothetical protein